MITITDITNELRGQLCWGVMWDAQLNMSMSFGKPQLRVREPYVTKTKSERIQDMASCRHVTVKGAWWLWIFCAYWTIKTKDNMRATSSSSFRQKQNAMARLNGQKLKDIKVDHRTGATEFFFDLGTMLRVRRFTADDSDIWTLYRPNGYVLGVRGDGTYTHGRGTTPVEKERAKKIKRPTNASTADA